MEFIQKKFKTIKLPTIRKVFLFSFAFALIIIGTWSITHIYNASKTEVKGIQTNKVSKTSFTATKTPTPTATQSAKLVGNNFNKPTLIPTPTTNPTNNQFSNSTQSSSSDNNTNNQSNNSSTESTPTPQQTSAASTPANQPTSPNNPTPSPQQPSPTVIVVIHPGGGDGARLEVGGYQYIYVTPTPNPAPFDGKIIYNSSTGQAYIMANKPIKECEEYQKEPSPTPDANGMILTKTYSALRSMPRYACRDNECGYVCDLSFAPPNTYAYGWPYGAKAVSETNEEKTFGNW